VDVSALPVRPSSYASSFTTTRAPPRDVTVPTGPTRRTGHEAVSPVDFGNLTDREAVRQQLAESGRQICQHSATNPAFDAAQRATVRATVPVEPRVDDRGQR
jgi:hypothetical protein